MFMLKYLRGRFKSLKGDIELAPHWRNGNCRLPKTASYLSHGEEQLTNKVSPHYSIGCTSSGGDDGYSVPPCINNT